MADEEKKPVVAYLGPEGSYTHQFPSSLRVVSINSGHTLLFQKQPHISHNPTQQAALSSFPQQDDTQSATLTPLVTIEDVFSAVQSGTAHRGVVPFENSSNGSVVFTLDLFADAQSKYPDILVCGEAYVAVRHCLLGYSNPARKSKTSATPQEGKQQNESDVDLSHIQRIYSHPQAWGQCKNFLNTYLKTAERHDVSSTSKAAEIASTDASGTSAALSSIVAAQLFGLDVLAEGVNDKLGNATRFLVIRRREQSDEYSQQDARTNDTTKGDDGETGSWKSLVTFTVEHDNPGALANCLSVFARQGINLTSINTRPSGVRNWDYIFFVELKGRRMDGKEGAVNKALEELEGACKGFRWLGSWENRLA
ncbi:Bifunctional chorismate mutase/prephenate dehydratase [Curvularia clavata]|uniref:prephenate dehydratase n=1 Tax=Curvularia clavata TaxID=95742 RepID=A0A9Q9DRL5_CURCL|nr:Bifunctional chorismate mutase/prephenate dehydratase [Curvularia clavata]